MSLRSLASLTVKLIAVYLSLQSLGSLALRWVALVNVVNHRGLCGPIGCFPRLEDVVPGLLSGATQLAASVMVWCFAERIGTLLVKDPTLPAPAGNWRSLGFDVLGVFLVFDCVSLFVAQLFVPLGPSSYIPTSVIWSELLRGGVGLCLLLGPRLVSGLLNFKNWGRDAEEIS